MYKLTTTHRRDGRSCIGPAKLYDKKGRLTEYFPLDLRGSRNEDYDERMAAWGSSGPQHDRRFVQHYGPDLQASIMPHTKYSLSKPNPDYGSDLWAVDARTLSQMTFSGEHRR